MCGIIGIYKKNISGEDIIFLKESMDFLMKKTEIRGSDTSGIAIKNYNAKEILLIKRNIKASQLIKTKSYKDAFRNLYNNPLKFISIIAHTRMQTNGRSDIPENNQPVMKNGVICAHNGIITNIEDIWSKSKHFNRLFDVDTEYICDTFTKKDPLTNLYKEVCGETNFALMKNGTENLIFATNTGSSYYVYDDNIALLIFSSEKNILDQYNKFFFHGQLTIHQLKSNHFLNLNEITGEIFIDNIYKEQLVFKKTESYKIIMDSKILKKKGVQQETKNTVIEKQLLEFNENVIKNIKRCTKCLLPETFPFIEYDMNGVCNFCHNYEKISYLGEQAFHNLFENRGIARDKLLLTFSGGRDSSYGMHLLKKNGYDILSYSYDWGMITDLARRNQSRMCGAHGVEHIIVSADISKKRKNVGKNIKAWLKRPTLGLIPLFMAGDKHYFYYANKVAKQNGLSHKIILCDNPLEVTYFKFGFAGTKPNFIKKGQLFKMSIIDNFKMLGFYGKEFILNPRLVNFSIIDTLKAYISYYFIKHDYINIFKYFEWNEQKIDNVLIKDYDWELSPDSHSTWRIGDGTAPFYNYIYNTVAGFSENDTFRSNQIREGYITRAEGMELLIRDNKPRYESMKWYLDAVGVNFTQAIKTINAIPKLYNKETLNESKDKK